MMADNFKRNPDGAWTRITPEEKHIASVKRKKGLDYLKSADIIDGGDYARAHAILDGKPPVPTAPIPRPSTTSYDPVRGHTGQPERWLSKQEAIWHLSMSYEEFNQHVMNDETFPKTKVNPGGGVTQLWREQDLDEWSGGLIGLRRSPAKQRVPTN